MAVTTLSEGSQIAASRDQVSADMMGEAAILNLKNGFYYGLDSVGASIWNLIQEPKTFAEIRDSLLRTYAVDRPRLESDLRELFAELAEQGLIDITS